MTYRRSIQLAADPTSVWRAFTDPAGLAAWHGHAEVFEARSGGRIRFRNPGWPDVEGVVEQLIPERRIRWRVLSDDSQISESFSPRDGGTLVRIVHRPARGDERWAEQLPAIKLGWDESIADLALYLEHGVVMPRHMAEREHFGATTRDTTAGIVVVEVDSDGLAKRAGLKPGDLLLRVGRAPLFDRTDLLVLLREHPPGTAWEITYARGGRVRLVSARL